MKRTRKLFSARVALSAIWAVALAIANWVTWQTVAALQKPKDNEIHYVIALPWWHYLLRWAIDAAILPAIVLALGWGLTTVRTPAGMTAPRSHGRI
jgi:hypothetical protein